MPRFGYTLMTEQSGPRDLVRYAVAAEEAGFEFEVSSDHFTPWLTSQGHSPNAWVTLGAVAQATSNVELMTYVTCPTMRYHPAVVAQQSATLQLLSEGRFTLGLGSGENLNEHVIGEGWPAVQVRQAMLEEAIHIIRELHTGELVTWEGDYFRVDSARIWDAPEGGVPIGVAVSGDSSIERFADQADHLIAVQPAGDLIEAWDAAHGKGSRKIGQMPISWDPTRRSRASARTTSSAGSPGVGRERRPADAGGLLGGEPVRPAGRRRRFDSVRPRSRQDRGGRQGVPRRRFHRRRPRPGR